MLVYSVIVQKKKNQNTDEDVIELVLWMSNLKLRVVKSLSQGRWLKRSSNGDLTPRDPNPKAVLSAPITPSEGTVLLSQGMGHPPWNWGWWAGQETQWSTCQMANAEPGGRKCCDSQWEYYWHFWMGCFVTEQGCPHLAGCCLTLSMDT